MFERHRFLTHPDDYQPVDFPPPGPFWCIGFVTGINEDSRFDRSVLIAILPKGEPLQRWWPDAEHVETEEIDAITFSDRFPRPDWWRPKLAVVPPKST